MSNFLFKEFTPGSAAAWKQKIQFELDGADYNKTLLTQTNEGITIKPFYHSDDFEKLIIPENSEDFKTCKKIILTSEEDANKKVLDEIKNGFKSFKFIVNKEFNIEKLFKNLLKKNIEFHFSFEFLSKYFITKIATALKNETVFFNIDIIGNLAKTGNWFTSLNNDFETVELLKSIKVLTSINVDIYQNAGANTVQQVAYALAHANEYFNKFGGEIAKNMQFNFAISNNYFFEISKIRAFKYLFNLVLAEYNCSSNPIIFTEPTLIKENNDLNNYEILNATISGSHTHLTNSNFKLNKSEVQELKKLATDSYYIESITKQIAEKALDIFKDIEKGGGLLSQLKEGTIQRKIKENAIKENLITVKSNKKAHKTLIIPLTQKRLKNEA